MATGLIEQMKSDLTAAMKSRDAVTTRTLRSALTAIQEAAVSGNAARDLADDEVQAVLKTQVKRREEAAEAFRDAGRDESEAAELAERDVLARYLPAEMDDDALAAIVDGALAEGGFADASQMGPAMKVVMAAVAGRADGKRVSALVRDRLTR